MSQSCIEPLESRRLLSITLDAQNRSETFVDSDGGTVRVSLRGPGSAEINLAAGTSGDITSVILNNTTDQTSFAVTSRGGRTNLGAVDVNGSLRQFLTTRTDLTGVFTLDGTIGRLTLGDVVGGQNINLNGTGGSTRLTLGIADNVLLTSASPLRSVTARRWLRADDDDAGIVAPTIGTLSITGSRRLGITGDFEGNLNLSGITDVRTLGRATIAGSVQNSSWQITGDTRSILIRGDATNWDLDVTGNLSGLQVRGNLGDNDLAITGEARAVKFNSTLAIADPQNASATRIDVGGDAIIRGRRNQRLAFSDNTIFATDSTQLYAMDVLQNFDQVGRTWTYHTEWSGLGQSGEESATLQVTDISTDGSGNTVRTVETTVSGNTVTTSWFTDGTGTHLRAWGTDIGEVNLTVDTGDLVVAPPEMEIGKTYTDSGDISGSFSGDVNGNTATGSLDGSAESSARLIGHEQIVTPAGTFLAAKVNLRLALRGTIDAVVNGFNVRVTFTAVQTQTFWQVPEVGIVKATSVVSVDARIPILGSQSFTLRANQELESFSG